LAIFLLRHGLYFRSAAVDSFFLRV